MSEPNLSGLRGSQAARRIRILLLTAGVALFALGLLWMLAPLVEPDAETAMKHGNLGLCGTPVVLFSPQENRWGYLAAGIAFAGVFLLMQYLFLLPRGSWRIGVQAEGRPMLLSAVGAGFAAVLISVGLLATLLEIPNWWKQLDPWLIWGGIVLLWAGWTVAFAVYWRDMDHHTAIARTMRFLVAGSVLEMLVAAPVHALVYSRDECYCARGSYTGLVFGGTAIVWLFGPGVYLLWLREKQRRAPLVRR